MDEADWVDKYEREFTRWGRTDTLLVFASLLNVGTLIYNLFFSDWAWWATLFFAMVNVFGVWITVRGMHRAATHRRASREKVLEWRHKFPKREPRL